MHHTEFRSKLADKSSVLKGKSDGSNETSSECERLEAHHTEFGLKSADELLVLKGRLGGRLVNILVDSGASCCFVADRIGKDIQKGKVSNGKKLPIRLADGSEISGTVLTGIKLQLGDHEEFVDVTMAPISYDMILGQTWLKKHNPDIDWMKKEVKINNLQWMEEARQEKKGKPMSARAFVNALAKGKVEECGMILLTPILNELKTSSDKVAADEEARKNLPPEVRELVEKNEEIFAEFVGLPPNRKTDHEIKLVDDSRPPPFRPIYPMSELELKLLREELDYLLKNERIAPSMSEYGAPIFYVKQNGKYRLVFDYRALNSNTVRNRAPLPNLLEQLDRLSKAKYFTHLDLASGFHQIRVKLEDIHKTAFRTKYGSFEWRVLPFGLCNAPPTFQSTMNEIFRDLIDRAVLVYMDDILIYSETLEEHLATLKEVFRRLKDNQFHCRLHKCKFLQTTIEYVGYKITQGSISVLPIRTQAIQDFETPRSWSSLQSFLGLANTIHRFIPRYAEVAAPLTDHLKGWKERPWEWNDKLQKAFEEMKETMCKPESLAIFDTNKTVYLNTDWSKTAVASVLYQLNDKGEMTPIAYHSRKCNASERSYISYDGEALALAEALRFHRHYLIGMDVRVKTDHQSLKHLMTQPKLRPVQNRWIADILAFDFKIEWTPGKWNTIADALSRRTFAKEEGVQTEVDQLNVILTVDNDLLAGIKGALKDDEFFRDISQYLVDPDDPTTYDNAQKTIPPEDRTRFARYKLSKGLLYYSTDYSDRIYVPPPYRTLIIELAHSEGPTIHNSWKKTVERINRYYHWPNIHKAVQKFCRCCDDCQRNKTLRQPQYGFLKPHDVPPEPWHTVSMDFTHLPPSSNGFDQLMVVVDSLTKMTRLIPCKTTDTAKRIASLFTDHIWKIHGLPKVIISDRDTKFTSEFWKDLMRSLNISQNMSSAYHPQTDGQTEQKNDWIKTCLRAMVNHYQSNWHQFLHIVEYGINDTVNSSTGYTPFYLNYGRHPRSFLDLELTPGDKLTIRDFKYTLNDVKNKIRAAQDRYASYVNRKRQEAPFAVGDLVLLSNNDFVPPNEQGRPSRKLGHKFSGPYKIIELVGAGPSYRLELPPDWHVHNVFHPSKLKKYYYDTSGSHPLQHLPPQSREIGEILANRVLSNGQKQSLVKWKDHSPVFNVWINDEDLSSRAMLAHRGGNVRELDQLGLTAISTTAN
jgi:hypothetical protein